MMRKGRRGLMFEVPLIATENGSGVTIALDPKGPNLKYWNSTKKTFTFDKSKFKDMHQRDHHYVEFTLALDDTRKGIRFPTAPENAMWVENEASCPKTPKYDYDIMKPLAVVTEDTLLAVNFNETKGQKFGFTLNFVRQGTADDTDPGNYISWGPGGENKDGGLEN